MPKIKSFSLQGVPAALSFAETSGSLLFPALTGVTRFCVAPLLSSGSVPCQPLPCSTAGIATAWISPSLPRCCLHLPAWQQAPGCSLKGKGTCLPGAPTGLRGRQCPGRCRAITFQLLSCQQRLALEPQLLWNWSSVLLEGLLSLTSLLSWVKAFDLMKSGRLDSL